MGTSARDSAVKARNASRKLQALPTEERVAMLHRVADALVANEESIMAENAKVILRPIARHKTVPSR